MIGAPGWPRLRHIQHAVPFGPSPERGHPGRLARPAARPAAGTRAVRRRRSPVSSARRPSLTAVASAAEGGHEDGFDGVDPVLGLVEHNRGRRLEYLIGHLEGVEAVRFVELLADRCSRSWNAGRQCMNFTSGLPVRAIDGHVHLVGEKPVDAILPLGRRLAHREPHVGAQEIDPVDALVDVLGEGEAAPDAVGDLPGRLNQPRAGPQSFGRADPDAPCPAWRRSPSTSYRC